jgi:carboxylate/amino acid/amine transporter
MPYLFLVSLIWAFSFGLIKTSLVSVNPVLVSTIRLIISLLVFLPSLKLHLIDQKTKADLILIGAIQFGVMYLSYIYAFQYLTSFEIAIFTVTKPIFVSFFSSVQRRRFESGYLIAAILAVIGAILIKWQDLQSTEVWWGFILVQISNIAFAIGQVMYQRIMQKLPQIKDIDVFGWLYIGAAGLTLLVSVLTVRLDQIIVSSAQAFSLLYLGVIASGLGFFLWNAGARRVNTGTLAVFNNLKIPLAVLVSLLFFGEKAQFSTLLIGSGVMVAGLILAESINRKMNKSVRTG